MNRNIKIALSSVLLLAIGYGTGRYVQPAKIVTKTETKVVTQEVTHENVKTVVQEVDKPNGEKDIVTTTQNLSVVQEQSATDTKSSTVITNSKPQWKASGMAGLYMNGTPTAIYGGGLERRILGPISAGIWGNTNREAGVSVSLEF